MSYDDTNLQKLLKMLKEESPKAKVGILGNTNARSTKGPSNAEIGLKHEFGDPTEDLPQRSFLRMPLTERFDKEITKAVGKKISEELVKEIFKENSLVPFVRRIGIVGVSVVLQAFETGGFGKWKSSNMAFKKNHQTLVETRQLMQAIISEVE